MRILPFWLLLFVNLVPSSFAADLVSRDSIREIQVILSLKELYDGRIDGLTGPKTERALLRYEQQLGWPLTGTPSGQLLGRLRREAKSALQSGVRGNDDHDKPKMEAESAINKKLEALTRDLNHTDSHLVHVGSSLTATQKEMERHFLHIFTEATVIAVTSFGIIVGLIGVGITIAVTIGFDPFVKFIVKRVEAIHEKMVDVSADRIAARIYGSIGGSSIDLYQHMKVDPDKPDTKALYDKALGIAVDLSSKGYKHAKSLIERVGDNISPFDKQVYEACVNNKLFYLATQITDATDEDKREIENILRETERIAAEYEASKEPPWWAFKETLAWAKLNFGYETAASVKTEVQDMMHNRRIPIGWKVDIKTRYATWASARGTELTLEIPQS